MNRGPLVSEPGGDSLPPDLRAHVAELHRRFLDQRAEHDLDDHIDDRRIETHVRECLPLCSDDEIAGLVRALSEVLHGLGPLDALMHDPTITEIMINGPGPVWIERRGRVEPADILVDTDEIRLIIDRVVAPRGLRLDRVVPFTDARLDDGSRVHVTIPPMAVDGPYVTIRRFAADVLAIDDFTTEPGVADLLHEAVLRRDNIVVSGGTGVGKTSLLNGLASSIPDGQRIVTIEDAAELRLHTGHVVRLEARPANAEGVGELSMRTLLRNALRMRPDRIVVGEVRGAEAIEMIQALNTGHAGSLSTCHANSPADALDRLVTMASMADVPVPAEVVRRQLRSAVGLIVHLDRSRSGRRHIRDVLAVASQGGGDDRLVVHEGRLTGDARAR